MWFASWYIGGWTLRLLPSLHVSIVTSPSSWKTINRSMYIFFSLSRSFYPFVINIFVRPPVSRLIFFYFVRILHFSLLCFARLFNATFLPSFILFVHLTDQTRQLRPCFGVLSIETIMHTTQTNANQL